LTKRETTCQQVGPQRLVGPERVEMGSRAFREAEQAGGTLTGRVPGLGDDAVGAGLPNRPVLCPELSARLACPLSCGGRVAGGEGSGGSREEQLRRFVGDPAFRWYPAERGARFTRRVCGKPGGKQCGAAVDGEFGDILAKRVVAFLRLIEIGQRPGKVAAAQRG